MMTSLGMGVSVTELGPVDHAPVFLGAAAHDQADPQQCEWCLLHVSEVGHHRRALVLPGLLEIREHGKRADVWSR